MTLPPTFQPIPPFLQPIEVSLNCQILVTRYIASALYYSLINVKASFRRLYAIPNGNIIMMLWAIAIRLSYNNLTDLLPASDDIYACIQLRHAFARSDYVSRN